MERETAPAFGLLTKTAAWNTAVQWIHTFTTSSWGQVQAHITCDRVVVYKIVSTGELEWLATRCDFGPAKIVGSNVLVAPPSDTLVKEELSTSYDEEPFLIAYEGKLLIVLSNGLLVSLRFVAEQPDLQYLPETARLHITQISHLPINDDPLLQFGSLVCTDERGRAVAVISPEAGVAIFHHGEFGILSAPAFFEIKGHVLHATFLQYSNDHSQTQLYLLLVKVVERRLALQVLEWLPDQTPVTLDVHNYQKIDLDGGFPEVVASFGSCSSALVASSTGLYLFTELTSGSAKRTSIELPRDPLNDDGSASQAVWTSCGRAHCSTVPPWRQPAVYLLTRSDGKMVILRPFTDGRKDGVEILSISTSTAAMGLAISFFETTSAHHCCTSHGDGVNGGVYQLNDGGSFVPISSCPLPEHAPRLDMVATTLPKARITHVRNVDEVYTIAGGYEGGEVVGLQSGIVADLLFNFDVEAMQDITNVWTITRNDAAELLFVVTGKHAAGTESTQIAALGDDGISIIGDCTEHATQEIGVPGFRSTDAVQALHFGLEGSDYIVATLDSATIVCNGIERDIIGGLSWPPIKFSFSLADVTQGLIVVAVTIDEEGLMLPMFPLMRTSEDPLGTGPPYPEYYGDVTALAWLHLKSTDNEASLSAEGVNRQYLALLLATSDGSLQVLRRTRDGTEQWSRIHIFTDTSGGTVACTSVYELRLDLDIRQLGVSFLCGLRDGRLEVLDLHITEQDTISCKVRQSIILGTSSTILAPPATGFERGYSSLTAACGCNLYQVKSASFGDAAIVVTPIHIADADTPVFEHTEIRAITEIQQDKAFLGRNLKGCLVVVMGESCYVVSVAKIRSSSPASKALATWASPVRLIWSSQLRCFIVASMEHLRHTSPGSSTFRSLIEFRQPTDSDDQASGEPSSGTKFLLQAGERIFGLETWEYTASNDRKYAFILVATGLEGRSISKADGRKRSRGRVHILQPSLTDGQVSNVKLSIYTKFDEPVHCIARYGKMGYICGHGAAISIYEFSPQRKKWLLVCSCSTSSAVMHITVQGTHIHVTTARDSLEIYTVSTVIEPCPLRTLVRHTASDTAAALGQHHVSLAQGLHLLSTKTGQVRALHHRHPEDDAGSVQPLTCVATVQVRSPLTRLVAVDVDPQPLSKKHAVLGSTIDGGLVGLQVLCLHDWAVLKWIERLCLRSEDLSPFVRRRRIGVANERNDSGDGDGYERVRLPMGLAGMRRYDAESEVAFQARTGMEWSVIVDHYFFEQLPNEAAPAADAADMEDVLYFGAAASMPGADKSANKGAAKDRVDGWERIEEVADLPGWAPEDMSVDGDVLRRLVEVRIAGQDAGDGGGAALRILLSGIANGAVADDDGVRARVEGDFVRAHLDDEMAFVEEAVEILRRRLGGWGYW